MSEFIQKDYHLSLHLFFLAFALATPTQAASQQGTGQPKPEISCRSNPIFGPGDLTLKKKELWDGYKISFGPAPNAGKESDTECMAAIFDPSGKEVYRTTDIDVMLDPATGMDIDGDGAPDVVVMKGSSGGSGGSWEIEVISLKPQPHVLFTSNQDFPPAAFRKDSQGRAVLWSDWGGNSDLGYSMAHANDPSARIVYRFTERKLKDVTPEFCIEIKDDKHFPRPTEAYLEHFKNSKIDSGQFESLDDEWTAGKVMSLALHYVFCRRFDNALEVIQEMWPKQDQFNLIKKLKEEMSNDQNCPDCAKAIEKWR